MTEIVIDEERCEMSDLYISQCAHCRGYEWKVEIDGEDY